MSYQASGSQDNCDNHDLKVQPPTHSTSFLTLKIDDVDQHQHHVLALSAISLYCLLLQ